MTKIEIRQAIGEATGSWWLFLVAAAWFVIALVVLRFNAPRHLVTRSPAPVKMNWEPGSTWSGGRSSLRLPRKLHVERGGGGSAVLWCVGHQPPADLGSAADVQLAEHLAQMVIDRARADEQPSGDLLVRGAIGNQPGDPLLFWGVSSSIRADRPPAGALARGAVCSSARMAKASAPIMSNTRARSSAGRGHRRRRR